MPSQTLLVMRPDLQRAPHENPPKLAATNLNPSLLKSTPPQSMQKLTRIARKVQKDKDKMRLILGFKNLINLTKTGVGNDLSPSALKISKREGL
jgi:hypothetical protein